MQVPGFNVQPSAMATLQRIPYLGSAYRQQSPGWDPRNGEGARQNGGRFNPPGSFATLYLAPAKRTVAAELMRQGSRQAIGVEGLLPRELFVYALQLEEVIDLTTTRTASALGVDKQALTSSDWQFTQGIGELCFGFGIQGIVSYSAADKDGLIVAVFPENLHGCDVSPELVDTWASLDEVLSQLKLFKNL